VVTQASDLDPAGISCAECGRLLASAASDKDPLIPSCEELAAAGAVPVPNFGWFCGQDCGARYETATGVKFARDGNGRIVY
jgi:hypothetical protein